jgi:hypothetical protein
MTVAAVKELLHPKQPRLAGGHELFPGSGGGGGGGVVSSAPSDLSQRRDDESSAGDDSDGDSDVEPYDKTAEGGANDADGPTQAHFEKLQREQRARKAAQQQAIDKQRAREEQQREAARRREQQLQQQPSGDAATAAPSPALQPKFDRRFSFGIMPAALPQSPFKKSGAAAAPGGARLARSGGGPGSGGGGARGGLSAVSEEYGSHSTMGVGSKTKPGASASAPVLSAVAHANAAVAASGGDGGDANGHAELGRRSSMARMSMMLQRAEEEGGTTESKVCRLCSQGMMMRSKKCS